MRPNDAYSDDYDRDRDRNERRGGWSDDDDEPRRRRGGWSDDDYEPRGRRGDVRRSRSRSTYPTFPKVIFILDIIFCAIRLLMVPLSLFGAVVMKQQNPNDPMIETTYYEVATNLAVGLFGLLAAALMLGRKRIGLVLGLVAILAVLANMGVGFWQGSLTMEKNGFKPGSPEFAGALFGIGLVVLIRLVLLGLYIGALVSFSRMPQQRAEERDEDRDW
jgi:hypothetical protein